jgi:ubiquinone/menaquinone biosynthesis C-methylase UbiE
VTSLEYDHAFAARLAQKGGDDADVVQGDAAALPFADRTFSSVVAVLVLHHLRSSELQDRTFAEVRRVLQPGGCFFAFEIPDGWFNRIIHTNSTFVPLQPAALASRLTSAGFAGVTLEHRTGGFRLCASRQN